MAFAGGGAHHGRRMKLHVMRHLWGLEAVTSHLLARIKSAGYDGVEGMLPVGMEPRAYRDLCAENALDIVFQVVTCFPEPGGRVQDHVRSFRAQMDVAAMVIEAAMHEIHVEEQHVAPRKRAREPANRRRVGRSHCADARSNASPQAPSEDGFETVSKKIHWMWWPALAGMVVGAVGLAEPRTLGVGYVNITTTLAAGFTTSTLAILAIAKFASWSIALGSGTSGGTLAPLLTLGAAGGYLFASGIAYVLPGAGIDPRVAALVGMAAMFAGAARALLASIVFALEATQAIQAAVPIVGGVTLAYFGSAMLMRTTIMTEKLARRGVDAAEDIVVHVAT